MVDSLSEVEGSIIDVKTQLEELDTELQNLHWENVDRISEKFSNLSDEINNLIGLIDDVDVSDKDGNWSKEGLTQIGLYAQEYEKAVYASQMYAEEIEHLNKEYLAGKYSLLEYQERLASLTEEQWNHINASESALDAIKELNGQRIDIQIDGINQEISAYEDLIQKQIAALDAEKDLHDYRKSIEETTKSKTDIERKLAAMANDDSQFAKAEKAKLQAELAEINSELEEKEYSHSIDAQKEALNKQLENFESEKDAEIESLRNSLENEETLIAQSFETVKQNASLVGEQITQIAQEHGVYVSDALITSWQQGENAIASYGTVLSAQSSAFIGNIMGVENEVWNLQAQANQTADSLAWMFATRADNLVNELAHSYYSEENLNAMTNALQQSLINTLERGYNVGSITSGLDSIASSASNVANAASRATQALLQLGAAQASKGTLYKLSGVAGGTITSYNKSDLDKLAESYGKGTVIPAYASGTRSTKSELIVTDEEGGELKLPKLSSGNYTIAPEGTQILTKKQTDMLYEWSKLNPNILLTQDNLIPQSVKNTVANATAMPNVVTRNVNNAPSLAFNGTLMHIDKVDSTNIKQMESIANKAIDNLVTKMNNGIKYRHI